MHSHLSSRRAPILDASSVVWAPVGPPRAEGAMVPLSRGVQSRRVLGWGAVVRGAWHWAWGVLVMAAMAAMPVAASGQDGAVLLMDPDEEAALALSAAPGEVAQNASVWVLEGAGYSQVRTGSNGWSCLVERDHPQSLAPLCYDPNGSKSVIPGVLELARLRQTGMGYQAAKDAVLAQMRAGALPVPSRPVLSLMLSPHQSLYSAPDGDPVGPWRPHVMIHFPGLTNEDLGLVPRGAVGWVQDEGLPTSYLVIPVADWSDGTPGRASGS